MCFLRLLSNCSSPVQHSANQYPLYCRIIATIRSTYITDETFTPEVAKRASPAAEGLCKWVHAMSSYDKVAKVVAPKKAKLAEAEASYQEVMVGLTAKQQELQVSVGFGYCGTMHSTKVPRPTN